MPEILKIALPLPDKDIFDYSAEGFEGINDLIGRRALVSFGKRYLTGVIVDKGEPGENLFGYEKLKPVLEIPDEKPVFSETMLKFTSWISEYYLCSRGETLKAALPQGMSPQSVLKIKLNRYFSDADLEHLTYKAPKKAEIIRELLNFDDYVTVKYLERLLKSNIVSESLESLREQGIIEISREVDEGIAAKTQKAIRLSPDFEQDVSRIRIIFDELDNSAPKQSLALSHVFLAKISGKDYVTLSDCLRETGAPYSSVRGLIEKGYLEEFYMEVLRYETGAFELARRNELELELTEQQSICVTKINEAMEERYYRSFLLHGVTGSGKTLVYLNCISECIKAGRNALVLVPEISLTPQLIDRFERAFPGKVSPLHSRMSEGARYDSWRQIYKGKSSIVIGARSAIFAPLSNIGLIVVDEEHDSSYKQDDPSPRYQARDCALVLGKMSNCTVVLGSATPSLESWYNAISGKYELLRISSRADNAKMPRLVLTDLFSARIDGKMKGPFSQLLLDEIKSCVEKKEGVILYQNRRGFASFLECTSCAHIPECPRCDVSLTYHKHSNLLKCHYCGYIEKNVSACKVCGSIGFRELGSGTQRIEEEIERELKEFGLETRIERADLDTTTRRGSFRRLLSEFSRGDIDILVGTQMVAKGLDFDRVTLVGIVNADLQLFLPDFRSGERTFSLITQVAGRAGRAQRTGKVIIQTSHPRNEAIKAAADGNLKQFYERELKIRREINYPPYSRFVRIEFLCRDESLAAEKSRQFASLLPRGDKSLIVLPNYVPVISKIRTFHRRVIIIKNLRDLDPSGRQLRNALKYALIEYKKKYVSTKVRVKVDVDSYQSL